jgi:hypothetical protein
MFSFSQRSIQAKPYASDGQFPEIFIDVNFPESFRKLPLRCSRTVFYLLIFYRNIYVSGYFLPYYICFYSIIYVSGNFPEIFITTRRTRQTVQRRQKLFRARKLTTRIKVKHR